MCCLIYKFLLILTQKMQISFLKILPENALKFVSKKMRICVKNFAQLQCQNEKINRQKLQKAENSTSLLFGLCIFSILRRRDTFRFLKNTAEVQRIVIAYNTSNLINAIMLILQKHFCIIYSFFHNKLFWCNSSI